MADVSSRRALQGGLFCFSMPVCYFLRALNSENPKVEITENPVPKQVAPIVACGQKVFAQLLAVWLCLEHIQVESNIDKWAVI